MIKDETLPYVVTNYSTYAKCDKKDNLNKVQEEIVKARDHFGIAGASRGGSMTQAFVQGERDYVSWF